MENFISRKDRIILSAIDIINELGMHGLSTKELASRQNISESALYRHFKNKDEIIEGVIEQFCKFDIPIYNSIIQKNISYKEKILEYIKAYVEYYESYPAITSILLSYESLRHNVAIKNELDQIYNYRLNNIMLLVKDGQDKNEISNLFTPIELACTLLGYCNYVIQQWRMSRCKYSIKDDLIITVKKILSMV